MIHEKKALTQRHRYNTSTSQPQHYGRTSLGNTRLVLPKVYRGIVKIITLAKIQHMYLAEPIWFRGLKLLIPFHWFKWWSVYICYVYFEKQWQLHVISMHRPCMYHRSEVSFKIKRPSERRAWLKSFFLTWGNLFSADDHQDGDEDQ